MFPEKTFTSSIDFHANNVIKLRFNEMTFVSSSPPRKPLMFGEANEKHPIDLCILFAIICVISRLRPEERLRVRGGNQLGWKWKTHLFDSLLPNETITATFEVDCDPLRAQSPPLSARRAMKEIKNDKRNELSVENIITNEYKCINDI